MVVSNDKKLKNIFMDRLKRSALDSQFPFLKYLPFMPSSQSDEFNGMIDAIISKRRAETGPEKRDLLQIFLDNNDADPDGFTHLHVREEMALFMFVFSHILVEWPSRVPADLCSGWLEAILLVSP